MDDTNGSAGGVEGAPSRRSEMFGTPDTPERIGPYRIRRLLGAGAAGVVYEAEQEHPTRRLALKVLRADLTGAVGDATRRRFEVEAEILGRLQHPAVAHVYDAGTARTAQGERPYIAMELVEGRHLGRWLEETEASDEVRLELFARLAEGVHHAHQHGVVHRDLKPANVLVDVDGRPRIVDFGVARVLRSDLEATVARTRTGELVGSLAYMSPEQVRGDPMDVDARSDVYALGAIAYQMLARSLPIAVDGLPVPSAVRAVLEEQPTRLASRVARLRGDVDTIVHKALEKDPERRYASAAELAADVRRFLQDLPIEARPPTTWYQLTKFSKRHRRLVAAVIVTFVVLVGAAGASTAFYLRAEEQRDRAEDAREQALARSAEAVLARNEEALQRVLAEEAEERAQRDAWRARAEALSAERVTSFLEELFELPATSRARADEVSAREMLDRGAERIGTRLAQEPDMQSRLMGIMSGVYSNLGIYDRAEDLVEQALDVGLASGTSDALREADLLMRRAVLRREYGDSGVAQYLAGRVAELHTSTRAPDDPDTGRVQLFLAELLREQGDLHGARELAERSLALQVEVDPCSGVVANLEACIGGIADLEGRYPEARDHYQRSIELDRDLGHAPDPQLLDALGAVHVHLAEYALAEDFFRQSLAAAREIYAEGHPYLAYPLSDLADMLRERRAFDEAEVLFEEALRCATEGHRARSRTLNNFGLLRGSQGRHAEAAELFEQAIAGHVRSGGERTIATAHARGNLGQALGGLGRHVEAVEQIETALAIMLEIAPSNLNHRAQGLYSLGNQLTALGRLTEAIPVLEEAHGMFSQLYGEEFRLAEWSAQLLSYCYESLGNEELARTWRDRMEHADSGH